MSSPQEQYNELAYYTLSHRDPSFIHQNVVDAFTAQNADENTKPIALVFALLGLYLFLEKNYTGKEVQQAHMYLGKTKKVWPQLPPPKERGDVTVKNVLDVPPGKERDEMIHVWCASVWAAYHDVQEQIRNIAERELTHKFWNI